MSLKNLIKVADYYNVRYGFNKKANEGQSLSFERLIPDVSYEDLFIVGKQLLERASHDLRNFFWKDLFAYVQFVSSDLKNPKFRNIFMEAVNEEIDKINQDVDFIIKWQEKEAQQLLEKSTNMRLIKSILLKLKTSTDKITSCINTLLKMSSGDRVDSQDVIKSRASFEAHLKPLNRLSKHLNKMLSEFEMVDLSGKRQELQQREFEKSWQQGERVDPDLLT